MRSTVSWDKNVLWKPFMIDARPIDFMIFWPISTNRESFKYIASFHTKKKEITGDFRVNVWWRCLCVFINRFRCTWWQMKYSFFAINKRKFIQSQWTIARWKGFILAIIFYAMLATTTRSSFLPFLRVDENFPSRNSKVKRTTHTHTHMRTCTYLFLRLDKYHFSWS